MNVKILPSKIEGEIKAPPSKSMMQRALAAALLKGGTTVLYNAGKSNDDKAALEIIQHLGATTQFLTEDTLKINAHFPVGGVIKNLESLHCGESGLSFRMFAFIAALLKQEVILTGTGSLTSRPIHFFETVFPQLAVKYNSTSGKLPVKIKGPLIPQDIEMDGTLSSQFLSGLLMAYAAASASDVTLKVTGLNSKPYIDLTLKVMKDFGMKMPENHGYKAFYFTTEQNAEKAGNREYTIESDWSNAAFLLVAGAVAGSVKVKGLDLFSSQGDKKIIEALQDCGCFLSVSPHQVSTAEKQLKAFHFNANDCPDLFPPLVALAVYCEGTSVIEGVHRLINKESNRAVSLQNEFGKLGIEITIQDNKMLVSPGKVQGGKVYSHNDHRIAMALTLAALKAKEAVIIEHAGAIDKSYPGFYKDMRNLGVLIEKV